MSERIVEPVTWRAAATAARDEGYTFFDWLGAADDIGRSDRLLVVLSLVRRQPVPQWLTLRTAVDRSDPRLASLRTVYPGAAWAEREAAELFGVLFEGGDGRRLLLGPDFVGTPLRKDEVLAARAGVAWPGTKEPGESDLPGVGSASPSRRRAVPPGVPEPAVWGDRDPSSGDPDPAEVAGSAVGGRVRRRPR